jgi:hypothetical protein
MMTSTISIEQRIVGEKVFTIGIHLEGTRLLVRKVQIIYGFRVPLAETYVLDMDTAEWLQQLWVNQLYSCCLN